MKNSTWPSLVRWGRTALGQRCGRRGIAVAMARSVRAVDAAGRRSCGGRRRWYVAGGASRRSSASPQIGLGLDGGDCSGGEPRVKCHSPHLLYIWHCATGAHQPSIGLGVPDQDASQGPSCHWTNWWRSILTRPFVLPSFC